MYQAFELSIKITVPTLVLMPRDVEFGTVFLGRSCESVILMSNTTLSDAMWSLHIPPGLHPNFGSVCVLVLRILREMLSIFNLRVCTLGSLSAMYFSLRVSMCVVSNHYQRDDYCSTEI